jgi:hypothetical protein
MQVPFMAIHGSVRFSLGRYTAEKEIDRILEVFPEIVADLRVISPYWDKEKNEPTDSRMGPRPKCPKKNEYPLNFIPCFVQALFACGRHGTSRQRPGTPSFPQDNSLPRFSQKKELPKELLEVMTYQLPTGVGVFTTRDQKTLRSTSRSAEANSAKTASAWSAGGYVRSASPASESQLREMKTRSPFEISPSPLMSQ